MNLAAKVRLPVGPSEGEHSDEIGHEGRFCPRARVRRAPWQGRNPSIHSPSAPNDSGAPSKANTTRPESSAKAGTPSPWPRRALQFGIGFETRAGSSARAGRARQHHHLRTVRPQQIFHSASLPRLCVAITNVPPANGRAMAQARRARAAAADSRVTPWRASRNSSAKCASSKGVCSAVLESRRCRLCR